MADEQSNGEREDPRPNCRGRKRFSRGGEELVPKEEEATEEEEEEEEEDATKKEKKEEEEERRRSKKDRPEHGEDRKEPFWIRVPGLSGCR